MSTHSASGARSRAGAALHAVGTVQDESLLDAYARPNPHALRILYGDGQLPEALSRYSTERLRETAAVMQQQYPGTAPRGTSKTALVEYLVAHAQANEDAGRAFRAADRALGQQALKPTTAKRETSSTREPRAPKPPSVSQRQTAATARLTELSGVEGASKQHLTAAALEVLAEEAARNPALRQALSERVRQVAGTQQGTRGQREALPPLVPVNRDPTYRIDTFAPPDPQFLMRVYGQAQLGRALQDYTLDMLKETAIAVQQRHPGTRPASRTRKADIIAYIVEQTAREQG